MWSMEYETERQTQPQKFTRVSAENKPSFKFQMMSGRIQLSSLTARYPPGLFDFTFFIPMHTLLRYGAVVYVAVVKVQKRGSFFFSSLSPFKVHKHNFSLQPVQQVCRDSGER